MAAEEKNRARDQARAQLDSIVEMVKALETEDDDAREKALETIREDPLEVSVRSDWHSPGEEGESMEYLILLCTGGPAVRIIGELGRFNEPDTAELQYQDWFTSWEDCPITIKEEQALLTYAGCFYFGR